MDITSDITYNKEIQKQWQDAQHAVACVSTSQFNRCREWFRLSTTG